MTDHIDTYLMTKRSQLIQIYIQDTFRHRHFNRHCIFKYQTFDFSHIFLLISEKYSGHFRPKQRQSLYQTSLSFSLCQTFPEIFLLQTFRFSDQVHSTSNMCNWGGLKQHYWAFLHCSSFFHRFSAKHSKGGNSTLLNYTKFKYTYQERAFYMCSTPRPT